MLLRAILSGTPSLAGTIKSQIPAPARAGNLGNLGVGILDERAFEFPTLHSLFLLAFAMWSSSSMASLFGEEVVLLFQLVTGQVREIERLSRIVEASKDQVEAIKVLNEGIDKTVNQIQAVESIIERAQELELTSSKSIADLNDYLERVHGVKSHLDELMGIRMKAAEMGIAQSSAQDDTANKMGQEMISTGSLLANESRGASPGRAAQISAASGSAEMMAKGIELQTMAQMVQLQALSLDLQRAQIKREMCVRRGNQDLFLSKLKTTAKAKLR